MNAPASSVSGVVPPYFNLLTAMRGVAALGVAIFHLCNIYRQPDITAPAMIGWFLPLANLGWFGVDLFFFISGYGLAAKLARNLTLRGGNGFADFAGNRVWRIFPIYWAACLLALALAWSASVFNHLDWRLEFPPDVQGMIAGLFLLSPLIGTPPLLPVVTWALSCELGFYSVIALFILFRSRVSDALMLCAAVAGAIGCLLLPLARLGTVFNFWPEFTSGLLAYAAIEKCNARSRRIQGGVLVSLIALGVVALATTHFRQAGIVLAALLSVFLWPKDARLKQRWIVRAFAWIGTISYPLFLLHVPIISRVMNLGSRLIRPSEPAFVAILASALVAAVLVAWVVYLRVERPLLSITGNRPASKIST